MSYKYNDKTKTYTITNLGIDDTVNDLEEILKMHDIYVEYKQFNTT